MPAEVLRAFADAVGEAVPLDRLQGAASRIIAGITGAEAGLVTAGAAAALTLGTAGILTGYDAGRMERLPNCEGFPHEFVVAREQRNGYDHAVRAAGARLVEVGFHEADGGVGVRGGFRALHGRRALRPRAGIAPVPGRGGRSRSASRPTGAR
jgi:L-seryl-tRNA(Ser) seleniumtransferase